MNRTQTGALSSKRTRALLIITGVALIPIVIVARHLAGRNIASVDPNVSLERTQRDDASNIKTTNNSIDLPDAGEVYRTADRLREASGLALASALYAANEQANRQFIPDVDALIRGIRSAGLLPPGITTDARAMLLSNRSKLQLRFRPAPFAIEVLSFPRCREDGPALMIRIPATGNDAEHGSVFIADRLGDIDPPAAFTSLADCVRAGWIDQSFSLVERSEAQRQQLRHWLATRRAH
ncbi:MAG: hypothetical protein AABN33_04860 [Acidobacteriota bacterium]